MIKGKNPRRVLLVDDDRDVLTLFQQILESSGFSVTAASEGGAAAKFHSDLGGVDLLITDIDMPGQTGFELADALSAKQPNLPVLFITGGMFSDDVWKERPTRNILKKPFSARMLIASVDKMLRTN